MAKFYVITPKNIEELKELQRMQEFVLKTLEKHSVEVALNKELTKADISKVEMAIFIGYDLHSLSEIFKFLEKDIKVLLFNVAGNGIYNLMCDLLQKCTDFYNSNPNTYKLLYDVWSSRELETLVDMSCKFPKLVVKSDVSPTL